MCWQNFLTAHTWGARIDIYPIRNINLGHLCTYLSFANQWSVPGYIICTVVLRYKHRLPMTLVAVAWTAYKGDNGFSFLLYVMAISSTAQVQIQDPVSKVQATVGHTSAESIYPHLTNTRFWIASWKCERKRWSEVRGQKQPWTHWRSTLAFNAADMNYHLREGE